MTTLLIDDPAYFDRLATIERDHWWSRGLWKIASGWLDDVLRGRYGLIALDLGCGSGGTLQRLAARSEISRVIGLDPSPAALHHAAVWPVVLGSALNLPFAGDSFDLVTCFDVLQHLTSGGDGIALREIERVLRPGGFALIRANGRGLWPDHTRPELAYDLRDLVGISRAAKFQIRRSTYANCLPAIATEMLGLFRRDHGHPQGRGLRIRPVAARKSRLMSAISAAEFLAITRLGLRLPVGHSTLLLVQKPGGPTR